MNKDEIIKALQLGPVAFGEDHGDNNAKQMALELINANHVKKLFVELCDTDTPDEGGSSRSSAGAKVRAAAGQNKNADQLGYAELAPAMVSFSEEGRFYQTVIKAAVSQGVLVYYYDKSVNDPFSTDGMRARNAHSLGEFIKHGKGTKVLLIGGQSHFAGVSGELSLDNIPGIKVFDFSKP